MLKHYITIALRNLWKSKLFTLINVAGLAIGMAACILIFIYVQFELSFDRFHKYADRICHVVTIDRAVGVSSPFVGITMPAFGPQSPQTFPEIESFCRIIRPTQMWLTIDADHKMAADSVLPVDSTFFEFFSFPLLKGSPKQVLVDPFSIVVTKKLAKKLFGDADPIGRIVTTASGNELKVTGLAEDPPGNSHIQFDALLSLSTTAALARRQQPPNSTQPIWLDSWQLLAIRTYIRLAPGVDYQSLIPKMNPYIRSNGVRDNFEVTLQPFLDVHLKSSNIIFDDNEHKGDISSVYTMAAVAILILIIASVNFMNLSTARATSRAREVGLRKVVGSLRKQLVTQFLGESVLLALLALLLSLSIAELLLPWLNQLTGYHLKLNVFTNAGLAASLLGLVIAVGILAGSYPAAVLSGFRPIEVLKGSFQHSARGRILRRVLVVFQFTLSIALICGTILIGRQMHYIQSKDLGYNRDQVLLMTFRNVALINSASALKNEIASSPSVESICTSNDVPGRQLSRAPILFENDPKDQNRIWSLMNVDWDVTNTLKLHILKGRDFSRDFPADTANSVIINEAGAREMGLDDPVGKRIYLGRQDSTGAIIVGMVKDFHFASLREKIEPLIISVNNTTLNTLMVRIKAGMIKPAMEYINQAWKKINPDQPISYTFLDDEFNQTYAADINFAKIGNTFSGLAIFIACLGLFGLASHTTEQRRKEIGIRKVLGASAFGISKLLILDYIRWVALANILAWPVAFWAAQRWLNNFAYHIEIGWLPFAIAGLLALVIAVVTVLGHALRAATSNPVNALRYE